MWTVNMLQPEEAAQVQALLQPLSPDLATQYFCKLAGAHDNALEVRLDIPGKGKGVISLKDFVPEELVFREPPLVGAQHTVNCADALVCSRCFTMVGSIEKQLAHRLLARAGEGGTAVNPDYLRSLWLESIRLPYSERFPMPALAYCPGGCTEAVYCSEACAQAHWAEQHELLCSGPSAAGQAQYAAHLPPEPPQLELQSHRPRSTSFDRFREAQAALPPAGLQGASPEVKMAPRNRARADALRAFRRHADATNDIFHLAAQVIARTIVQAERLLGGGAAAAGPSAGQGDPGSCWRALQAAWTPFAAAWRAPWWECVAAPEDVADAAGFRQELRGLAEDSLHLLREALCDERFPALFSLEVYGSIIGMFELNNLGLYVASPVEDYLLLIHVGHEDGAGGLGEGEQNLAQLVTRPLLDALGESYAAGCEGSAFYALQSCLNHSCAPNAHAFKRDGRDVDGSAVILARRGIRAGEEVCVSYIDESQGYSARQAALRDYGFACTCERCAADSAAAGKGKALA